MLSTLIIHQSSEMYGSDKIVLYLARAIIDKGGRVLVVLPADGPLARVFRNEEIPFIFADVLKVSRASLSVGGICQLIRRIGRVGHEIAMLVDISKYDLVYSNTIAVLLGAVIATRFKKKHVWHVHEIIEKPKFVSFFFKSLISIFSNRVIANSTATYNWLRSGLLPVKNVTVVLNGVPDQPISEKKLNQINPYKITHNTLVIGLVGRINKWKGHSLLLTALEKLYARGCDNFSVVFLGGPPPGQEHFLENLKKEIDQKKFKRQIFHEAFVDHVYDFYNLFDLICVPSIEPEPFGLVAVEAMVASKPVVASNFGGLAEIVINNQTGLLFEPLNADDLANKLEMIYRDPDLRINMGVRGRARFLENFSDLKMNKNLIEVCNEV